MDAVEQCSPDDHVVEVGAPCAGGNHVPALPPMADFEEAETEFIFGKFEYGGEVDSATSCHMNAFQTVFSR